MNFGMIDVLVSNRTADIRSQAASRRSAARGLESGPAAPAVRRPRLRSRIGFALVEAGLHLAATARPTRGGSPRAALNERS
jgi:hypothetical protein